MIPSKKKNFGKIIKAMRKDQVWDWFGYKNHDPLHLKNSNN